MKIAILGDRKRYEAYLPPFVHDLPVELTFFSPSAPSRQILAQSPDAQVILADAIAPVGAELIHGLPRLQLIHSDGVGYNAIDLDAALGRRGSMCACKGCNADAVAEIAVMLMLMVTRRAVQGYRAVIEGRQMAYKEAVMAAAVPEFADHSVGAGGPWGYCQGHRPAAGPFRQPTVLLHSPPPLPPKRRGSGTSPICPWTSWSEPVTFSPPLPRHAGDGGDGQPGSPVQNAPRLSLPGEHQPGPVGGQPGRPGRPAVRASGWSGLRHPLA